MKTAFIALKRVSVSLSPLINEEKIKHMCVGGNTGTTGENIDLEQYAFQRVHLPWVSDRLLQ